MFHEQLLCVPDTAEGTENITINKDPGLVEFNKSEYISKFKNGNKIF